MMRVPGAGKIAATTIVAEIGDIMRFNSPKWLCNWVGLTPRVRKSRRWRKLYHRLSSHCGKRGAKVAVARRLSKILTRADGGSLRAYP